MFTALVLCPVMLLAFHGSLIVQHREQPHQLHLNLRYLSPHERANISPYKTSDAMVLTNEPILQLDPNNAHTIYISNAGFLQTAHQKWTDMVPPGLTEAIRDLNNGTTSHDEADSLELYFQDSVSERHPWFLEKMLTAPKARRRRGPDFHVSGSRMRLRDTSSDRYICVIPGKHVIGEAIFKGEDIAIGSEPDRLRVG